MPSDLQIQTMTEAQAAMAVDWADGEGWNPGLWDTGCFYWTDPHGFFIGLLDGKPVATISAVAYDNTFGFMGFYIVLPEYRGKGYGLQMWNAALEYLGDRTIGLDGVPEQQEKYRKAGFVFAHNNYRYEGRTALRDATYDHIIPLEKVNFRTLANYDHRFFPALRPVFLKHWIEQPEAGALGYWDGDTLRGCGVIRKCRFGWKIGPLYGETCDIAHELFHALVSVPTPGQPVFLDTPGSNPDAIRLAERHGMRYSFETARMYRGSAPDIPHSEWFGVTSFELG